MYEKLTNLDLLIRQLDKYQSDILQICNEFMHKHQLQFFGYLRCYNDQQCFVLSTHPSVYEYLIREGLPLNAPVDKEDLSDKKYYYLLPDPSTYAEAIHNVALNFNLYHPFDLFFRHEQYYELFCYGINQNNSNKINYYINNLAHFDNFAKYFKEKAQKIINNLVNNPSYIPTKLFEPVKNIILNQASIVNIDNGMLCKEGKHFIIKLSNENLKLTQREVDCLKCLLEGKTAHETAEKLFLSRRTVEGYLDTVREKTYCRNKLELITKMKDIIVDC